MIIFVHFYFPFSVHCYIIIYNNENESLKIQKEAMFEYIKEKGLGEEAQIIVNKKIRQKTNNKIKDKEWQQEL